MLRMIPKAEGLRKVPPRLQDQVLVGDPLSRAAGSSPQGNEDHVVLRQLAGTVAAPTCLPIASDRRHASPPVTWLRAASGS